MELTEEILADAETFPASQAPTTVEAMARELRKHRAEQPVRDLNTAADACRTTMDVAIEALEAAGESSAVEILKELAE